MAAWLLPDGGIGLVEPTADGRKRLVEIDRPDSRRRMDRGPEFEVPDRDPALRNTRIRIR